MWIIAQLPLPTEVADVSGKLTEYGIVAILLFILLLVLGFGGVLAILVYRQLFGTSHGAGIIPTAIAKHELFLDRLTKVVEENRVAISSTEKVTIKIESTVNKLLEFVRRTDGTLDDVIRVYRSHVRIFRSMADKIGVLPEIEPHIVALEELFSDYKK